MGCSLEVAGRTAGQQGPPRRCDDQSAMTIEQFPPRGGLESCLAAPLRAAP